MTKIIAHITDTHLGDPTTEEYGIDPKKNLKAILEATAGKVNDLIITGDLGTKDKLSWLFEKAESYIPGFKVILGNHDEYTTVKEFYHNTQSASETELYYSLEDEFYKYIFMDSSSSIISQEQLEWLKEEINTLKKIVVFIHHPVLGFQTGMDIKYPLKNRDNVKEIFQQSRNPITLFCGHYHMPDKREEGKITQYITPAASFQVKKNSMNIDINGKSFGYRIIILHETGIETRLATNFYDYFSLKTG